MNCVKDAMTHAYRIFPVGLSNSNAWCGNLKRDVRNEVPRLVPIILEEILVQTTVVSLKHRRTYHHVKCELHAPSYTGDS